MNETNPLDIVHVVYEPSFSFGGIGTYARELARQQLRSGKKVGIVFLDRFFGEEEILSDHRVLANSGYSRLKSIYDRIPMRVREYLKLFRLSSMVKQVDVRKSGIYHIHSPLVQLILPKDTGKRADVVQTVHGYYAYEAASDGDVAEGTRREARMLEVERRAYSAAGINIAVDRRIETHIRNLCPKAEVVMRPNFVDTDEFEPATLDERARARSELGIGSDRVVFLSTRRFELKNGLVVLAHAIRLLPDVVRQRSSFVIVGNGSQLEPVRAVLGDLVGTCVELPGAVGHDEIKRYYHAADIFVIPSVRIGNVEEATSISTLEAMSSGNLVIASRIGGLAQLIRDEVNGFLVEDNDAHILAQKMEFVLLHMNDFNKVREEARQTVLDLYSGKAYEEFMSEQYKKCSNKADGPRD